MPDQSRIDSQLSRIKAWYTLHWPLCLFCNHLVKPDEAQLAHIIRRSWASNIYSRYELQTMKLNTGLAHPDCHDIADNKPKEAILLPRFNEVMFLSFLIDPAYFEEQKLSYGDFYTFPDFIRISDRYALHLQHYEHHGDLLILPLDI